MLDTSSELRAARLHRIAAVEIARHRAAHGLLGAALEGSLATGAVWPASDVDFTIVPLAEQPGDQLVEWERGEALPFLKEHPDGRIHLDVCGEREGIPWHKHVTDHRALRDLVDGYPMSFIRPAEGPYHPGAHWFLDGLAVMQVVEDPEGLLAETRHFVASRRFAAEVWEGRRSLFFQELRRQVDLAHETSGRGDADQGYGMLIGDAGIGGVAAQLWFESAQRIISGKEQDGRLAEVTRAAGCPEAHALYRRILAVDPERAHAVVPLLRRLVERAASLYRLLGTWPPQDFERLRETTVWGAYVSHLLGTLSLAPGRGHPAYLYQSLGSISLWAIEYPDRKIAALSAQAGTRAKRGCEALVRHASEVADLAERIRMTLLGPLQAVGRTRARLAAADQLVKLIEARL